MHLTNELAVVLAAAISGLVTILTNHFVLSSEHRTRTFELLYIRRLGVYEELAVFIQNSFSPDKINTHSWSEYLMQQCMKLDSLRSRCFIYASKEVITCVDEYFFTFRKVVEVFSNDNDEFEECKERVLSELRVASDKTINVITHEKAAEFTDKYIHQINRHIKKTTHNVGKDKKKIQDKLER